MWLKIKNKIEKFNLVLNYFNSMVLIKSPLMYLGLCSLFANMQMSMSSYTAMHDSVLGSRTRYAYSAANFYVDRDWEYSISILPKLRSIWARAKTSTRVSCIMYTVIKTYA